MNFEQALDRAFDIAFKLQQGADVLQSHQAPVRGAGIGGSVHGSTFRRLPQQARGG
jgi:hypothetical protein